MHVIKDLDSWKDFLEAKVDVPNSVVYLNQTSIFEWYMVWCGFKNGYQNDMCLKEIGIHAQNMITILGSIVRHNWVDPYDYLTSARILTLVMV